MLDRNRNALLLVTLGLCGFWVFNSWSKLNELTQRNEFIVNSIVESNEPMDSSITAANQIFDSSYSRDYIPSASVERIQVSNIVDAQKNEELILKEMIRLSRNNNTGGHAHFKRDVTNGRLLFGFQDYLDTHVQDYRVSINGKKYPYNSQHKYKVPKGQKFEIEMKKIVFDFQNVEFDTIVRKRVIGL